MNAVRCCVWEITLACNLRCGHCGATAGRARPDELTPAEALRLAADLANLPTHEVTLMGGETAGWRRRSGHLYERLAAG
jgi:MoaA/NifB/PqqE/SkfB family radical SAM enzyme